MLSTKFVYKHFLTLSIFIICLYFLPQKTFAEEIVLSVSGNASESSSEVSVDANSNTSVTQTSQASIENSVVTTTATGDNTASSNSNGDIQIQTGNIDSTTTVSNENVNTDIINDSSCANCASTTSQITNNGSNSNNLINFNTSTTISSTQLNTANIINNFVTTAATGENVANNNSGDVTIITGNIKVNTNIQNKNVNSSLSTLVECGICDPRPIMMISGNGANSHNTIYFLQTNALITQSLNIATIVNNNKENLNTGANSANGNRGGVFIKTGNIESVIDINNENINGSFINPKKPFKPPFGGQEEPSADEKKPPATTPSQVSQGNGDKGNGKDENGNGGEGEAAEKIGEILPITGNFLLFYLTLANLMLFIMGWYLRFRSGCAPNVSYA